MRTGICSHAGSILRRLAIGPTVDTTIDGVTGTFVVGDSYWTGHRDDPTPRVFGRISDKVLELAPAPQGGSTTTIRICGCPPPRCDDTSPAPAATNTVQTLYGPLPANTTLFATRKVIPHASHDIQVQYTRTNCPVAACVPRK